MKRIICLAFLLAACSKKYDSAYDTSVAAPAYRKPGPRILVDQGHHNHHRLRGTYRPFAELLRNDGCDVRALRGKVTPQALADARVLVISTALGTDEANMTPAFSAAEVEAIVAWIERGGSLLLITDHFPFGEGVRNLATPLGVEMSGGMTFDEAHYDRTTKDDSRLVFSRANGLLGAHPITEGVDRVMTFTGQSVRSANGTVLLRLSDTAVNRAAVPRVFRSGGDVKVEVTFVTPKPAKGWAQAIAMHRGKGRVVVLCDAAMVSAQLNDGRPIGMNVPETGNRQFLLNVIHWLARTG